MHRNKSPYFPLIIFFILSNALLFAGKNWLSRMEFDQEMLIVANLFLFAITMLSAFLIYRNYGNSNPHAMVRSIYLGTMLKLFTCAIAAFVYIMIYKNSINKPSLFLSMGLYIVYTVIEVSVLTKLLRGKKNA